MREEFSKALCGLIETQNYEKASELLDSLRKMEHIYDDTIAVYDAEVCLCLGQYEQMLQAIARGLKINFANYKLYLMLGEYYLIKNVNQAYLCFENALFYCRDVAVQEEIKQLMESLKSEYNVSVNNVSIVILSYNLLDYTRLCIDSIRKTVLESAREIVVVDNASVDGSVEWLREQKDIILRENSENSGFPRGCNQGIELANARNDIYLLNNDTVLPPNALFWLRMGLYESEVNGTVGSVTNWAGNLQRIELADDSTAGMMKYAMETNVPTAYPYEDKLYLVGFSWLIKREAFDVIGNLDERFSPGNFEDTDYCLRVLLAGYKNVLCRNSFVIHFGSRSFGKKLETYKELLQTNEKKFLDKWGFNVSYYFHPKRELALLMKEVQNAPLNVLDIGCGCGALLGHIRGLYPETTAFGVEIVPQVVKVAGMMADVVCGDVESMDFPWEENFFDYIIMGDVLEHLKRPDIVLKKLHRHLKKGGHIIVSMPNVKHYSVMLPLLMDDVFPYSDAGILDTTHLKMYTGTEIKRLITESGYFVEELMYTTNEEPDDTENKLIDLLMEISNTKDRNEYLAYQYLVKAIK